MKLAASNIAWTEEDETRVLCRMKELGFTGVEIAPTRFVPNNPYAFENLKVAQERVDDLRCRWNLQLCSMQSILYGRSERLFGPPEEWLVLAEYTEAAIRYAAGIGCPHVVFGSPRNRILYVENQRRRGVDFFARCAEVAKCHDVVIGLEANPTIYGTNYLNTTLEVFELVKTVGSPNLKINLDLGAILENSETTEEIARFLPEVSHVHISEPMLAPVEYRPQQKEIAALLKSEGYAGWVSLEMKNSGNDQLLRSLELVFKVFGLPSKA